MNDVKHADLKWCVAALAGPGGAVLCGMQATDVRGSNTYYQNIRYDDNWERLGDFADEFEKANPDSHVNVVMGADGAFKRMFVGYGAAKKVVFGRLVGVEGADSECAAQADPVHTTHADFEHATVCLSHQAMEHGGLDFYAVDACHTKHIIVTGMQLHLLVGRNGNNKNVIMAWSLELKETAASYRYFADQCKLFGLQELMLVEPGPVVCS